jgi:hypothetical protein
MFRQYRNIFGEPKKGIHRHRTGGVATVDLLATIGAAYLLATPQYPFGKMILILFGLAIIFHWLFGVETAVNKFLGLVPKPRRVVTNSNKVNISDEVPEMTINPKIPELLHKKIPPVTALPTDPDEVPEMTINPKIPELLHKKIPPVTSVTTFPTDPDEVPEMTINPKILKLLHKEIPPLTEVTTTPVPVMSVTQSVMPLPPLTPIDSPVIVVPTPRTIYLNIPPSLFIE